jgi:hypothetical protein
MITCKSCQIVLPEGPLRCPMCRRFLGFRRVAIFGALAVGGLLLLLLLAGSDGVKARVQSWRMSPEVVLKATEELVAKNPAVHNVVGFSPPDQSTVEHWDSYRWRVSGYVDSQPKAGSRVRTLYFAVVQSVGSNWRLEDLELQNIDQGGR